MSKIYLMVIRCYAPFVLLIAGDVVEREQRPTTISRDDFGRYRPPDRSQHVLKIRRILSLLEDTQSLLRRYANHMLDLPGDPSVR